MADNYVDLHYNSDADTMTEQEGIELHGKDGIFCTSPIYTDIPLRTKAQSVAEAINELFGEGTGAHNGSLRAVIDNKTGAIQIVVGEVPKANTEESAEEESKENVEKNTEEEVKESYTDYNYTYEYVTHSEEIKAEKDGAERTQTISQIIVTALYDAAGKKIMYSDYDEDTGEIIGFYDRNDVPIYLAEWRA